MKSSTPINKYLTTILIALTLNIFSNAALAASSCYDIFFDNSLFVGTTNPNMIIPTYEIDGKDIPAPLQYISPLRKYLENAHGAGLGYGRTFDHYIAMTGLRPDDYRNKVVVDVGSGFSPFVDVMVEKYGAKATAVDILFHRDFSRKNNPKGFSQIIETRHADGMINLARRIGASSTQLPFPDDSVDLVVSVVSIVYLPPFAQQRALAEILRVLKPGGSFYPAGGRGLWSDIFKQWGVVDDGVKFTKPLKMDWSRVRPVLNSNGIPLHNLEG